VAENLLSGILRRLKNEKHILKSKNIWKSKIMERTLHFKNEYIKSSLHTIAPYVGKLRPEVVSMLIDKYSSINHTIYDPFCGSGTVPLEAWIKGRNVIGVDLNYYAFVLTKAKLFPYPSLDIALKH